MATSKDDSAGHEDPAVHGAIAQWRQGDCALGNHGFVYRIAASHPATRGAHELLALDSTADLPEVPVAGFCVISQTCDIVRRISDRPFVQVAVLQEASSDELLHVKAQRRPRYAYVPGIDSRGLVADLDRVMTVEKPLLATWPRTVGCTNDVEARALAEALGRKFRRFAFPDEFTAFVKKLRERLTEKHGKDSPEGRALRALEQIRVRASPDWRAAEVSLLFYFVPGDGSTQFEGLPWYQWKDKWLGLVKAAGRFRTIEGIVMPLVQMTAEDYVHSDPLDLDALSSAQPQAAG